MVKKENIWKFNVDDWKIHFDDKENVVLSIDSIPYKSFEETIMPTMYFTWEGQI